MNRKKAANILLVIFSLTVIFHILVLTGLVPAGMIWGGRLKEAPQRFMIQLISILLNIFLIYVVLQKANYIARSISRKWLGRWLKSFALLFLLNMIADLFAARPFDRTFGTMIAALSALFCWRLAQSHKIEKRRNML